jgi:hypothetical protein
MVPAGAYVSDAFSQVTVIAVFVLLTSVGVFDGYKGASATGKVTTELSSETPWAFVAL